ncbi:MAG TPA: hypothetical protein VKY85_19820 [Candidatus Angelobacter sp.]|nr:hypothetical protein [Candidatus Angelobacter sp.]
MSNETVSKNVTPEKIKQLASRYENICKSLPFADHKRISDSEFFKLIHNPGYTTLADVAVATNFLDVMEQQAKAIETLNHGLITSASNLPVTKAA